MVPFCSLFSRRVVSLGFYMPPQLNSQTPPSFSLATILSPRILTPYCHPTCTPSPLLAGPKHSSSVFSPAETISCTASSSCRPRVNNVGVMYDFPEVFANVPEKKLWELININIASVTMMTYIIIPQMVQRKKGIIVNMSSISSFNPLPLMAVYSASKVFVDWFSRALNYEYKDQGIIVQSLIPSYISTSLVKFSSFLQRPNFIVPDPHRFVNSAIQTIGVSNRTTGFWSHGLQYWMYELTPVWMWYPVSWYMQKSIDNHQRYEKKE
ncbi:Inactive hydroxysteroid dehydrogenase-like protein 1 [Araneus ventricosus]|uniref:Inactive hydroxysteroid dehydrogenase-like protein 1 n=1 Tax=Araneus ventricosus TaxID=182803 RepID=A0A4Y2UMY6_ARAVE|nr:Inactive hydroxysteroid dehydrogenase-like protein 1 [Araneus ventricosus]